MAGMDLLTTLPPVIGSIGGLCTDALQALASRILTVLLAILVVGGVGGFAMTAFAWLWLKHMAGELHLSPATPLRGA